MGGDCRITSQAAKPNDAHVTMRVKVECSSKSEKKGAVSSHNVNQVRRHRSLQEDQMHEVSEATLPLALRMLSRRARAPLDVSILVFLEAALAADLVSFFQC